MQKSVRIHGPHGAEATVLRNNAPSMGLGAFSCRAKARFSGRCYVALWL